MLPLPYHIKRPAVQYLGSTIGALVIIRDSYVTKLAFDPASSHQLHVLLQMAVEGRQEGQAGIMKRSQMNIYHPRGKIFGLRFPAE